jgi:hypothetical protein
MNRRCSGFIVLVDCFELPEIDLVVHQIIDCALKGPRLDLLISPERNHDRVLSFPLAVAWHLDTLPQMWGILPEIDPIEEVFLQPRYAEINTWSPYYLWTTPLLYHILYS